VNIDVLGRTIEYRVLLRYHVNLGREVSAWSNARFGGVDEYYILVKSHRLINNYNRAWTESTVHFALS
jgi:hypothetical protein